MKIILNLFLGLIILQAAGCRAEDENYANSRPRTPLMVSTRFVDESGKSLLNTGFLKHFNDQHYCFDRSKYKLICAVNGEPFRAEDQLIEVYFNSDIILLPCSTTAPKGHQNPDSVWIYTLIFSCQELYGNENEHTFVIEKKEINTGLLNNFERLLYDGKVIATNMEGDGSDNDRLPVVIVVPQK